MSIRNDKKHIKTLQVFKELIYDIAEEYPTSEMVKYNLLTAYDRIEDAVECISKGGL